MQTITLLLCVALSVGAEKIAHADGWSQPEGSLKAILLALHPPIARPTTNKDRLSAWKPHRSRSHETYMQSDGTEVEVAEEERSVSEKEIEEFDPSKLKNKAGKAYAPWMEVDVDAIAKAKAEREAMKQRQAVAAASVLTDDNLRAEIEVRVISSEEIELRWETTEEAEDLKGFILQRSDGSSPYETLSTYDDLNERMNNLKASGPEGGKYYILDGDAVPGTTYTYRVLDEDKTGKRSIYAKTTIEASSGADADAGKAIPTIAFAAFLAICFIGGALYDPSQTTTGANLF